VYSDWEDVTSDWAFQVFGAATGKARLTTVDRLTGGTRRRRRWLKNEATARQTYVYQNIDLMYAYAGITA